MSELCYIFYKYFRSRNRKGGDKRSAKRERKKMGVLLTMFSLIYNYYGHCDNDHYDRDSYNY